MTVKIIPIEDHSKYSVNGHLLIQVSETQWIVPNPLDSLSQIEKKAFTVYKTIIIDNPRFKKHPKSTYKI
ncbi:hypothetical protein ACFP6C_10225 [Flavobacterium psychroterrae]